MLIFVDTICTLDILKYVYVLKIEYVNMYPYLNVFSATDMLDIISNAASSPSLY